MRLLATTVVPLLLVLGAASAGWCEEPRQDPGELFRARIVDPGSEADIGRLRDDLNALGPGAWSAARLVGSGGGARARHQGLVRALLAGSLGDDRVRSEIAFAQQDPDDPGDRLERLLLNLRGRPGLGAALVRSGAVTLAAMEATRIVTRVAGDELVTGDAALAAALLSEPRAAAAVAQELAELPSVAGLHLVADVVTGDVAIPAAGREALAEIDFNLSSLWVERDLGAARRQKLVRTASSDPDPGLRVVASSVLHLANTAGAATDVFEAKQAARSHRIEADEWRWLGRLLGPPPAGVELSPFARARSTWGWIALSHVEARSDPGEAEAMAALARSVWAGIDDARTRGVFVRVMAELAFHFDLRPSGRERFVPSFGALLDDWKTGRPGDPPSLRKLESRLAEGIRRTVGRDYEPDWDAGLTTDESSVRALVPDIAATDIDLQDVAKWIERDPQHLHDRVVRASLSKWAGRRLPEVLAEYPEDLVRALLTDPPRVGRAIDEWASPVHDASGSLARRALLVFLEADRRHARRLLDPDLSRDWPARDRILAGRQLHRLAPEIAVGLAPVLADDAFAEGFIVAALEGPVTAHDAALLLAARVVTRIDDRPALRGALLDGEGWLIDHFTLNRGLELDDTIRAALGEVLATDSDPLAGFLAARLLAATGRADAFDTVFASDAWLWGAKHFRDLPPVADLAGLVRDDATLAAVLRYIERKDGEPRGRVGAFRNLAELEWAVADLADDAPDGLRDGRRVAAHGTLAAWVEERLQELDPDVAEGVAGAWLDLTAGMDGDVFVEGALAALRAALKTFPDGPSRRRIAAYIAEW